MMERDILHEQIRELKMMMDRAFYTRNSVFAMIRALFLKYITDNFVGAFTAEDMRLYAEMQKMLATRDFDKNPKIVGALFEVMSKMYGSDIKRILASSINDYEQELFGSSIYWQRNNIRKDDARNLIWKLSEINLTEADNSHTVGKKLVKELTTMLSMADYRNITGYVTGKVVATIAKKILQVKEGETFLDFASGTGLSTLTIVEDEPCKIINSDILESNLALAVMLYIMYGYRDFKVTVKSYDEPKLEGLEADKIFVDPPFGVKMGMDFYGVKMDSVAKAVEMATAYLNFNNPTGLAVVTVNSGYLFGTSKNLCYLKQNLLATGFLKAVVALPLNVPGTTGVTVNLLVIDTNENEKVIFANACGKTFSKYVDRAKGRENIISEEGINKVAEIVNFGIQEEGLSTVVSVDEIMKNNFDLMPSRYVKEIRTGIDMTLEEIDNRLAALYAKLGIKEKK